MQPTKITTPDTLWTTVYLNAAITTSGPRAIRFVRRMPRGCPRSCANIWGCTGPTRSPCPTWSPARYASSVTPTPPMTMRSDVLPRAVRSGTRSRSFDTGSPPAVARPSQRLLPAAGVKRSFAPAGSAGSGLSRRGAGWLAGHLARQRRIERRPLPRRRGWWARMLCVAEQQGGRLTNANGRMVTTGGPFTGRGWRPGSP